MFRDLTRLWSWLHEVDYCAPGSYGAKSFSLTIPPLLVSWFHVVAKILRCGYLNQILLGYRHEEKLLAPPQFSFAQITPEATSEYISFALVSTHARKKGPHLAMEVRLNGNVDKICIYTQRLYAVSVENMVEGNHNHGSPWIPSCSRFVAKLSLAIYIYIYIYGCWKAKLKVSADF